jgi:hypothetical protein
LGLVKTVPLLIVLHFEQLRAVLLDDGQRVGFLGLEEVSCVDQRFDQRPCLVFVIAHVGRRCRQSHAFDHRHGRQLHDARAELARPQLVHGSDKRRVEFQRQAQRSGWERRQIAQSGWVVRCDLYSESSGWSGNRTVTKRELRRSDNGGIWNTTVDNFWVLEAAASLDAALYNNSANAGVNFAVSEGGSFNLFASDGTGNTYFPPGSTFNLTATFADGSTGPPLWRSRAANQRSLLETCCCEEKIEKIGEARSCVARLTNSCCCRVASPHYLWFFKIVCKSFTASLCAFKA